MIRRRFQPVWIALAQGRNGYRLDTVAIVAEIFFRLRMVNERYKCRSTRLRVSA